MGQKVANCCNLRCMIQGFKWYSEPLDGKTYNVFIAIITVVHNHLYFYIPDDFPKFQLTYIVGKWQDHC